MCMDGPSWRLPFFPENPNENENIKRDVNTCAYETKFLKNKTHTSDNLNLLTYYKFSQD